MLATSTLTRTMLRIEMLALELQSINDRSLKDKLLNEIIAHCMPLKYLEAFTIYGMDGDEAHMRLEVHIDYDEHEQQIKLFGDGSPDDIARNYAGDDGPSNGTGAGSSRQSHCPHMRKAVDLYMRLVKEKGLQLHWTVRFREKREEMRERFGLCPALIHDCTVGGMESEMTNSRYSELKVVGRVSPKALPSN